MNVDAWLWLSRGPHADTWLCRNTRRRDGGARHKLAARVNLHSWCEGWAPSATAVGVLWSSPWPLKTNPQMLSTINSTNPMPANSTARATKSYSSQCRESESITFIPVRAPFLHLLIKMYRTSVSGVFRPKSFWFRRLWQKPGQRFAVCGGNPA